MINLETRIGLGTLLRRLLEQLDGDLELIYQQDGQGYRPRFTPIMKALMSGKSLTIKQIAATTHISHSATCQTIAKMMKEGMLYQVKGNDARERVVGLTTKGETLLPVLQKRWAATDRAADELDQELDVPLSTCLSAAIDALDRRSFMHRISENEGKKTGASK